MSMRFPGGLIATSPVNARYPSGVWTQAQTAPYQAQNVWTRDRFWPNTTLLLQGDGAVNGAQNNTFLDSSTNNFTITRNGNTTQGSFTPYEQDGYWSNYFDGSGDNLTSSIGSIASGASFTFEFFAFFTGSVTTNVRFFDLNSFGFAAQNLVYRLSGVSTGSGAAEVSMNGSQSTSATGVIKANVWQHHAVSYNGTTLSIFVDGTRVISYTPTAGSLLTTVAIGSSVAAAEYFTGYMSNFRLVIGSAVYTPSSTTITIPSAPLTAITNTSLLTCQSNRFKDNSTNNFTLTVNGNTSVQAFQPFPGSTTWSASVLGGSGYFDGTGDYLGDIGTTSSFNFLHNTTALFTFECWVYIPSTAAEQYLFDNTNGTSSQIGCSISIVAGGALSLFITRGVTGVGNVTAYVTSTGTVPTNQWVHIAVTYDQSLSSNNAKFYINGAAAGSGNKTGNTPSSSNASNTLRIGTFGAGAGAFITGYISNLRISNSIVYSSAFTPPTAPVTGGALLLNMTNAGIYDNSMMNNLETVGNAQVSTSVVKYGTGSMAFDGNGDWLQIPNSQNFNFGSGNFTVEGWVYCTNTTPRQDIFTTPANGSGFNGLTFSISGGNFDVTSCWATGSWQILFASAGAIVANAWYHFAIVRNGGTLTVYINGVSTYSNATLGTSSLVFGSDPATISYGRINQGDARYLYGNIDDFRVTKGAARYIGNFTPPIARLPAQ